MRNELIARIETAMAASLSTEQLAALHRVLVNETAGLEIEATIRGEETEQKDFLTAFLSAKRVEGCSDKTIHYYKITLEKMIATLGKPVQATTTDDMRHYLDDYQHSGRVGKSTIDNMRRIFSSFFAWLEDEDYIVKSPMRRIHKVKTVKTVKTTYSDEALEMMRDGCETLRDLAIVDLLASTGMRVGELVHLNRADIDFDNRECIVFGKGSKERKAYFDARTKIHLRRYLDERDDDNPALFVTLQQPHARLKISGVEIRLRQLGRKLEIPRVHPHKFRRTLATVAIDKGMPVEQVQQLLGHSKIDTTMHYAMVNQVNVKESHRRFIC